MPSAPSKSTYAINSKGQWLNGNAAASYLRMLAAGCPAGGISGKGAGRTYAEQAALYAAYKAGRGNLAARPGTSLHERGNALDVSRGTSAQLWMVKGGDPYNAKAGEKIRANSYGWVRTVNKQGKSNEPWHFAYDPAKDTKAKADLSARLKAAGYKDTRAFQKARGLSVDGVAGPVTWAELLRVGDRTPPPARTVLRRGDRGVDVAALAKELARHGYSTGSPADAFGPKMEAAVKDFQKRAGLTVDGVAGPRTMVALATVTPPPSPEERGMFRFGQANLRAARLGGLPDGSNARADFLRQKLHCSLYALSEVSEAARTAIDKRLGAARWQLHPEGYVCNVWDSVKWTHAGKRAVSFGTGVHGAVCTVLTHRPTGRRLDVISLHVRPRDSFGQGASDATVAAGKAGDVERALRLLAKDVPTIIAGDFNGSATDILTAAGLRRATPIVDTYDGKDGRQALDQVWITTGLEVRGHTLVPSGTVSDHSAWVVNLTILDPKAV